MADFPFHVVVSADSDYSSIARTFSDATVHYCDGVDDNTEIQKAIDAVETAGAGMVKLVGQDFFYSTGVEVYRTNDVVFDFYGCTLNYSGTGTALSITEDRTATQTWRDQVLGGRILAVGAAITSATAIGLKTQQLQFGLVRVMVENFQAGVGVQLTSGAASGDFSENNELHLYFYDCKTGLYCTGSGGTAYNAVPFMAFDSYIASSTGIKTDDAISSDNLHIGVLHLWVHKSNHFGLDLTRAPDFHIDYLAIEDSAVSQTGFVAVKTRTHATVGRIDHLVANVAGKLFDLYAGSTSELPSYVEVGRLAGAGFNPNLQGIIYGVTGRNVAPNSDMTSNVTGYEVSGGTLAYEAAEGARANGCASLISSAADTADWFRSDVYFAVNGGETLEFGVWCKTDLNNTRVLGAIMEFDASKVSIRNPQTAENYYLQTADGWSYLHWKIATDRTAKFLKVGVLTQKPNNTSKVYFDDFAVYIPHNAGMSNSGAATVASGATTVVVTHSLANTPTRVSVTARLWSNAAKAWVTAIGATTFTINVDADPGAGTSIFDWRAQTGEG